MSLQGDHAPRSTPRYHPRMSSNQLSDAEILRRFGFEPDPVIEAYKQHVDRTLLRENLKRTPDERWRTLAAATRLAQEVRRAGASRRAE